MRRRLLILPFVLLFAVPFSPNALADKSLAELQKDCKHFDYKVRLAAIRALQAMGGEKAEIALRFRVVDEDWEVQIAAIKALGEMKAVASAEVVARAAVEGQILKVRRAAARALRAMEIPGIFARVLKVVKRGRDAQPRIHALETAPQISRPEDAEAIAPLCADRELRVRAAAYRALGATRSMEAVPTVLRGLRDKEVAVRVAAGIALGEIGGPEALKGIVSLELKETDPYVTERISRTLRKLDPAEVVKYLAEVATAQRKTERRAKIVRLLAQVEHEAAGPALVGFLADEDPITRAWAARGVGLCGYVEGIEALETLVTGDPDTTVQRMALEALVKIYPEADRRTDLLGRVMSEGKPEVRIRACVLAKELGANLLLSKLATLVDAEGWKLPTAAIITMGILGHEEEVEVLAKRIEARDWRIRAAVVEGLGLLRHMDAVPYLIGRLSDKDPVVKSAALKNLQILSQLGKGADVKFWVKWYEKNKDTLELTKKGYREEVPDDYYGKSKYLIEILKKAQIVCVLGKYDHAEWVLEHLGIRQTVVRPQQLLEIGLNPKQLVLINCEGSIGRKEAEEHLRWFVHVGGYLMTTDWALQNALIRAFPGFVDRDQKSKTGNDVVEIEAADPDHPLLKGVFAEETKPMWWLEVIAFPMKVIDPFRTEILIDSVEMLSRKYGSSTMAVAFEYGHGTVEHCISHFFLQEEGFTNQSTKLARMVFAADNLGIPISQIRKLEANAFFDGQPNEEMTKEIAQDYSMFKLIVNFVVKKRKQVEQE